MGKKKKCILKESTANGYQMQPKRFGSVKEAMEYLSISPCFYYQLYDENGKLIRKGYCG